MKKTITGKDLPNLQSDNKVTTLHFIDITDNSVFNVASKASVLYPNVKKVFYEGTNTIVASVLKSHFKNAKIYMQCKTK